MLEPLREIENLEIKVIVNERSREIAIVDLGSKCNFVSLKTVKRLNLIERQDRPITTVFGNGTQSKTDRIVRCKLGLDDSKSLTEIDLYVLDNLPTDFILGLGFRIRATSPIRK